MPLSKLYDLALVYASELHRDQVREGSGIPYIAHLLSVSSRVLSAGGTEFKLLLVSCMMPQKIRVAKPRLMRSKPGSE
jgi:(p)ppGpp synthase/HD superfamily hydrolase